MIGFERSAQSVRDRFGNLLNAEKTLLRERAYTKYKRISLNHLGKITGIIFGTKYRPHRKKRLLKCRGLF